MDSRPKLDRIEEVSCARKAYPLQFGTRPKRIRSRVHGALSSPSALQRLKDILTQLKLAAVYRALTKSPLWYGSIIWDCISDTKSDTLQNYSLGPKTVIENRKHKDGRVCHRFHVKKLTKYDMLVVADKVLHGKCPDILQDNFTKRSQISSYSTRNSPDLHLPKPQLERRPTTT